jgi:hypothetical protein
MNLFDTVKQAFKNVLGIKTKTPLEKDPKSPLNNAKVKYNLVKAQNVGKGKSVTKSELTKALNTADKTSKTLAKQGTTITGNNARIKQASGKEVARPKDTLPWWAKALNWVDTYTGARSARVIVGGALDKAAGRSKKTFTQLLKESTPNQLHKSGKDVSGSQILGKIEDGRLKEGTNSKKHKVSNAVGGFLIDLLLDPTSYLSFGTASTVKKGATAVGKKAGNELAEKAAKQVAEKEAKAIAKKIAEKAGKATPLEGMLDAVSKAGKVTKGNTAKAEFTKGLVFHVPFTSKEKVIKEMKYIPSDALKAIIPERVKSVFKYHGVPFKTSKGIRESVDNAGKSLTNAERVGTGMGNELAAMVDKEFKGYSKKWNEPIINLIERGKGGSPLYDRVSKVLGKVDYKSAEGKKLIQQEISKYTKEIMEQGAPKKIGKSTGKFKFADSMLEKAGYIKPAKGETRLAANDLKLRTNASQNIIQKLASQKGKTNMLKHPEDVAQWHNVDKEALPYWYKANEIFDTLGKSEPKNIDLREDYVTHLFKDQKSKDKYIQMTKHDRASVKGSASSRFNQKRLIDAPITTLKKAGLNVETDLPEILKVRGRATTKNVANQQFWDELFKDTNLVRGKGGKVPKGFGSTGLAETGGVYVNDEFTPILKNWLAGAEDKRGYASILRKPTQTWRKLVTSDNPMYHVRNLADNTAKLTGIGNVGVDTIGEAMSILADPSQAVKLADGTMTDGYDILAAFKRMGGEGTDSFLGDTTNWLHSGNKLRDPFQTLGSKTEGNSKFILFLDRIKKGYTKEQAMDDVNRILFNYRETPDSVRNWKNLFPFITWKTKNVPLMAQAMLDNPLYGNMMKAAPKEAYSATGAQQSQMPGYGLMSGMLPISKNGRNIKAVNMNPAINDLNMFSLDNPKEAFKSMAKEAFGMLNPVVKNAIEVGVMNRPAFLPEKPFRTDAERLAYMMQNAMPQLRNVGAMQEMASDGLNDEDGVGKVMTGLGAVKNIDTGNVQVGRNYDWINQQNETINELKANGTPVLDAKAAQTLLGAPVQGNTLVEMLQSQGARKKTSGTVPQSLGNSDSLLSLLLQVQANPSQFDTSNLSPENKAIIDAYIERRMKQNGR